MKTTALLPAVMLATTLAAREGLAIVKARGVKLGHPSPVAEEIRQRIVHLRDTGLSWQAVVDRLDADGVPGPAGGVWHPTSVRRVYGYAMRGRLRELATAVDDGPETSRT